MTTSKTTRRQVIRKIVSVQFNDKCDDDATSIIAYDEDIVANYVTSLICKFLQFDVNFNIMLVFAHSYDVQPFHEKYLQDFNATVLDSLEREGEDSWGDYRSKQTNILLTYKMAMFDACPYTDMIIFVDYLPDLDDYSHAIRNLKNGYGFCYLVFDPETVEAADTISSIYQKYDLHRHLQQYHSIADDSCSDLVPVDPNMEMLLSMLEVEENNAMHKHNYYDTVTY
ncbi:uncharacterized protein Ecym_8113 [Eremothecium cymbalariae DBVPG|uniref:Uncharacterized protein n=1 Tax=Eremothecium cymbalariae (strain CBS 270.75 / DBVPG 7215 / KCTC 17166 / NRRL Y-17582) TaxID=931890 RepID=G8JX33_ERECY|nr:Hypothetical protein Ecym_8113 [Eremothecium cymbalariae DBVPG\